MKFKLHLPASLFCGCVAQQNMEIPRYEDHELRHGDDNSIYGDGNIAFIKQALPQNTYGYSFENNQTPSPKETPPPSGILRPAKPLNNYQETTTEPFISYNPYAKDVRNLFTLIGGEIPPLDLNDDGGNLNSMTSSSSISTQSPQNINLQATLANNQSPIAELLRGRSLEQPQLKPTALSIA